MEEQVLNCFLALLGADQVKRVEAEKFIESIESHPSYSLVLISILSSINLAISYRQMAGVLLKQYIDKHWSDTSDKFVGNETPNEVKVQIRNSILMGLSDQTPKIRAIIASCISKIAKSDWPDNWPNLFEGLTAQLKSGKIEAIHGSIRCLTEISHDMTDEHISSVIRLLFPELLTIYRQRNVHSSKIRSRVIHIFYSLCEAIVMIGDVDPSLNSKLLFPILPHWFETFIEDINNPSRTETNQFDYILPLEIIKTVTYLINNFPKQIEKLVQPILPSIWNSLVMGKDQYIKLMVESEDEEIDVERDSDSGDVLDFDAYVYTLFDFVNALTENKRFRKIALHSINELIRLVMYYMQMTKKQEEEWMDPNQLILNQEDESLSYTVRIAGEQIILNLVWIFEKETCVAVVHSLTALLEESKQMNINNNPRWWKVQEAALVGFGRISENLINVYENKDIDLDFRSFFRNVIFELLHLNDYPYLRGRALWVISRYAPLIPKDLVTTFFNTTLESLTQNVIPVKVAALQAIHNLCVHMNAQELAPRITEIIQLIIPLASQSSEEALILSLETLLVTIKVDEQQTAALESIIGPLALSVWVHHPTDHILTSIVSDIFDVLIKNKLCAEEFERRIFPVIASILQQSENTTPGLMETAVEILSNFISNNVSPQLPSIYITNAFPHLMNLLLKTDDHELLQNGAECVKSYVSKASKELVSFKWNETSNGVEPIFQFIAKLLDPSISESAGLFVGELIIKIILKMENDIRSSIPPLLNAITRKLATAQTPSFIQSLVMVFAQLIHRQPETVIQFLANEIIIDGKNGLTILLEAWCSTSMYFTGEYEIKVSNLALAKLYSTHSSFFQNIIVKGDQITQEGIITRSKARKKQDEWTKIPVPAKIVKILVNELNQNFESENEHNDGDDDEDEDQSWEDLEEENEEEDFKLLSDILDDDIGLDEEVKRPLDQDFVNDPLNQVNLRLALLQFFKQEANSFLPLASFFNQEEKEKIKFYVNFQS